MDYNDPMEEEHPEGMEEPQEGDEEMMDVEDIPVTQEDAWAVIR